MSDASRLDRIEAVQREILARLDELIHRDTARRRGQRKRVGSLARKAAERLPYVPSELDVARAKRKLQGAAR